MALTLIGARLGEVVDKVTQASPPGSFTGSPLKVVVADINIGAIADYVAGTGFSAASLATVLGVTAIAWATGTIYAQGGTVATGRVPLWNPGGGGLQFFETNIAALATDTVLLEIDAADLTAGDNLLLVAICY